MLCVEELATVGHDSGITVVGFEAGSGRSIQTEFHNKCPLNETKTIKSTSGRWEIRNAVN